MIGFRPFILSIGQGGPNMVPLDLLLEHLKGLVAVWGIVLLAGFSLCAVLRLRLGLPGYVLLGIVYWTISLYVFCFDGGLDVALGLALAILGDRNPGSGLRRLRHSHIVELCAVGSRCRDGGRLGSNDLLSLGVAGFLRPLGL